MIRRTIQLNRLLRYTIIFHNKNQINFKQLVNNSNSFIKKIKNAFNVKNISNIKTQKKNTTIKRKNFKKTTQKQFYAHILQINLLFLLNQYMFFHFWFNSISLYKFQFAYFDSLSSLIFSSFVHFFSKSNSQIVHCI